MPNIPGASEKQLGRFVDLNNVQHDNYGAVGDGISDDTQAIRDWLEANAGGVAIMPPAIYGISEDIDLPPATTIEASGAVLRWIGGVAPADAVLTCNLLGEHGLVLGLNVRGLTVDVNGQPRGVKLCGIGPGSNLDLRVDNFSSVGVEICGAPGPLVSIGYSLNVTGTGFGGSTVLMVGDSNAAKLELSASLVAGEPAPLARGLVLTEKVTACFLPRVSCSDATLPVEVGKPGGGGGCTGNVFGSVRLENPHQAPANVTVGPFTGTVGIAIRANAEPNSGNSVLTLRDATPFTRALFEEATGRIAAGGAVLASHNHVFAELSNASASLSALQAVGAVGGAGNFLGVTAAGQLGYMSALRQLGFVYYYPGFHSAAVTYTTNAATLVDVDAANLSVSFTVPPSGTVWVEIGALVGSLDAACNIYIGLREGSAIVDPTDGRVFTAPTAGVFRRIHYLVRVSGLVAGAAKTWKLGWGSGDVGKTARMIAGGYDGPITMRVFG